jgi:hypothetical protein
MAELGSFDIGTQRGVFFSAQVPGAQGFVLALSRFGQDIEDFSEFWNTKFKVWWYALRQLDYASAGTATGDRWERLSDPYRLWKNKHFPSAPLLVLRGPMKDAITSPNAPGSVWRSTPNSLEVGTTVPYAIFHQTGTRRMPARPPIRFSEADRVRVGKLLQEFVAAAWKQRRADARGGTAA